MAALSKRGQQSQSIEPWRETSAADRQSADDRVIVDGIHPAGL